MDLIPLHFQTFEQWAGWGLGVLTGLIAQGEAQAFFVLLFQVYSQRERPVYDLNPLNHIDARSLPVFLLAGWGWGKKRVEEPSHFPQGWPYRSMLHLSAPVANVCLAGIFGSVYMFLPSPIIKIAIEINVLIAMANFMIPIPPMALGRALCSPFSMLDNNRPTAESLGAVFLTILVAVEYWTNTPFLESLIIPPTRFLAKWIMAI